MGLNGWMWSFVYIQDPVAFSMGLPCDKTTWNIMQKIRHQVCRASWNTSLASPMTLCTHWTLHLKVNTLGMYAYSKFLVTIYMSLGCKATMSVLEIDAGMVPVCVDFGKLSAKNACHRKTWTNCRLAPMPWLQVCAPNMHEPEPEAEMRSMRCTTLASHHGHHCISVHGN